MKSNPESKSASKDSLFLLEVLVDKIVFEIGPCYPDKEFKTCVSIAAATMEPLEICDDESCLHSNNPFVKHFNCGKSCLFSLKEGEINSALSKFPVTCAVVKSLPCGCLPSTIAVGEATIDMTKEFMLARQSHLDDPTAVSYQALKDSFTIKGPDGNKAGEIMMFLRISCFGHNITTKFQGSGTPGQGILTGGGGGRGICNPQKARQNICSCSGAQNPCVLEDEHYSQMPCMDNEEACFCCGKKNGMVDPMGCRNTDAYCLHLPKGRTKEYEEVNTHLNGNDLKIKVPAQASVIKKISQTHYNMITPYSNKQGTGPCEAPCGKNQISMSMPSEAICCHGPPFGKTNLSCTSEGCTQVGKHPAVKGNGNQQDKHLINKNVFVLKVAKTAMDGDKKCKLELEFTTPKGPDKKPAIEKITRRQQCNPDYCCPPGNRVIFRMPGEACLPVHKARAHFKMDSDGKGEVIRDDPTKPIMPSTAEEYQGVKYQFDSQVIKLRIGKYVETPQRTSKFEYQFMTPAVAPEKEVVTRDNRTAQCLPTCAPCCPGRCCR